MTQLPQQDQVTMPVMAEFLQLHMMISISPKHAVSQVIVFPRLCRVISSSSRRLKEK